MRGVARLQRMVLGFLWLKQWTAMPSRGICTVLILRTSAVGDSKRDPTVGKFGMCCSRKNKPVNTSERLLQSFVLYAQVLGQATSLRTRGRATRFLTSKTARDEACPDEQPDQEDKREVRTEADGPAEDVGGGLRVGAVRGSGPLLLAAKTKLSSDPIDQAVQRTRGRLFTQELLDGRIRR